MHIFHWVAALLVAGRLCSAHTTNNGAIDARTWAPLCELSEKLKKAPGTAIGTVEAQGNTVEATDLQHQRLQVYILQKALTEDVSKLLPLLYALEDERRKQAKTTLPVLKTAIDYTAKAIHLAGEIDEFGDVLKQQGKSRTLTCLTDSSGAAAALTTVKELFAGCNAMHRLAAIDLTNNEAPTPGELLSQTDIQKDTADGDTKCPFTDKNAATDMFNSGSAHGEQEHTFAGGLFSLEAYKSTLKKREAPTDCKAETRPLQQVHCTLTHLHSEKSKLEAKAGNRSIEQLISSANFNSYFKQAARMTETPKDTDFEQVLGQTTNDARKYFWGRIEATKIPGEATGDAAEQTLGKISDPKKLSLAAIYYQTAVWRQKDDLTTQLKKLRDQGSKKDTNSAEEKDKECNTAGDNKAECEKKTGCTYDEAKDKGKRCKLSEEAKKVADGTAKDAKTNTTGSNSFVINKTPLLLAFLLF
uniref:Variant surface glycoprotein 622 n=1 Tax=Trypanosoma brucei TaxID=5691 RepID=M4SYJ1_9TRYP|nr:variant surface glycoprotein 622 [Trypanosoma brucei]